MRRLKLPILAAAAAALVLVTTACDREQESAPVALTLMADSIIEMDRDTLSDGSVNAVCNLQFEAAVSGPATEHAIMRGANIRYVWWEGGAEISEMSLDARQTHRMWVDSLIAGGQTRVSERQGFGQSEPGARPVRGTATFTYGFSNADTVATTPPFNFYCY